MRCGISTITSVALAVLACAVVPAVEPPPAEALATLDLPSDVDWYYRNDVGIVLAYAGDKLYRLDLLADEFEPPKPLTVPGLAEKHSVLPIARTGLLLVPSGSYAIDTLSGAIAWRAGPLPTIDVLFSFSDAGVAVMRTRDDGGRLFAIDLSSGKRVWEITRWARLIWSEPPYLRAFVDNAFLTIDVRTGEIVREDPVTLPKAKRIRIYPDEHVLVVWNNRQLTGYSIPLIPPATAAPSRELWQFKVGSPMIGQCIKIGNCRIARYGDDVLYIRSATRNEIIRLSTGELIANVKKGFWGAPVSVSPTGKYVAYAAGDNMKILDGATGAAVHEIRYPKGSQGMKSLRYMSWPSDDLVMTVFPDKKRNPRKMIGFSCSDGAVVWTTVLPDVADYVLTSEQRAQLVSRITSSLIMSAVSAANPTYAGGMAYHAVFVPNLDVSVSFAAGVMSTLGGEAGGESAFATARKRYVECERRIAATAETTRYFVAGNRKTGYDILKIDLISGGSEPLRRYQANVVHAIVPFPAFDRAVTLENDHRRLRLLKLD